MKPLSNLFHMIEQLRNSLTKIKSTFIFRLCFVMFLFNIPSFMFSFFLKRHDYFNSVSATGNLIVDVVNSIFLYRPFPDPFVISLDILFLTFIIQYLNNKWFKLSAIYYVCILFLYQCYSFFIIFCSQ